MIDGRYIYAVVLIPPTDETYGDPPKSLGNTGIGGRGDEIYLLQHNNIGAFVSASPVAPYQTSRENLLAHERALEAAMKYYILLPMQFSMIAESELDVMNLLRREYDKLVVELERFRGRKELGLKAIFHESIFQDILATNQAIQKKKAEIERSGTSQSALIEIGKMVEAALASERDRYRDDILSILSPLAEETKINKTFGDRMVLNVSFLVTAAQEDAFDQKVNELDEVYSKKMKFKYVGNVPPYNFVRLALSLKNDSQPV
ncbi:MAG: hypothetical protein HY22_03020 [[Candidatus Thermochlorobacteriaceae] bacterium GBChlB]|nr:MAG: hypothetical protein HY22_03020 [[Candidatus Thermochlorobacteriaceae] bacterium GBChlB]